MTLEIMRLTTVNVALAAELNPLFDDEVAWDDAEGRAFLADPNNLFVLARLDGVACGFLTAHRLQRFDRRRAEVMLYEIGVDEAFQRRGVGRALIEEVKRWAAEVGADEVWVLTEATNDPALGLYAATGGERSPDEIVMFSYGGASKE